MLWVPDIVKKKVTLLTYSFCVTSLSWKPCLFQHIGSLYMCFASKGHMTLETTFSIQVQILLMLCNE